jgi:hypothetical protein
MISLSGVVKLRCFSLANKRLIALERPDDLISTSTSTSHHPHIMRNPSIDLTNPLEPVSRYYHSSACP